MSSSFPKEPRQLMINLMYLVLTALLALNVSSEILHAFKTINQSIKSSNTSIEDKNSKLYTNLEEQEHQAGQEERIKPFNDRAKEIKKASQGMFDYLEKWKERIIDHAGGYEDDGKTIKRQDDIDASTFLLVEQKGGDTVKSKIVDLRKLMLSVVKPDDPKTFANQLPMTIVEPEKSDNNPAADWKVGYFQSMPVMACVTLLSKFQNDVRNSEAMVINQLMREAGDRQVKFDEIAAIAVPKNSYALTGQKVEASIMLAAYNKAINPQVQPNTGRVTKVENGVASWEVTAGGVGMQTVRGKVSMDLGGRVEQRDFEFKYMVGSTGASVQLDKMNVFYIGVPNPITISAAGYSVEDVSISIPGATITPGAQKGQYSVMMATPGKVFAAINAKTETGIKQVGGMEVRVKFIPDPVGEVGGKANGGMPSNVFKAQLGVLASLKQFDFDARFVVSSFEFSMLPKRGELIGPFKVNGSRFELSKQVMDAINRAKPGDKIFIEEIKARGPDGKTRGINTVSLTLI